MPGIVEKICVKEGQEVAAGDPLVVIIAMKMEVRVYQLFNKKGLGSEMCISSLNSPPTISQLKRIKNVVIRYKLLFQYVIKASTPGTVEKILYQQGESVQKDVTLIKVKPHEE